MSTESILSDLQAIEEGPWADLRGKPLDSRGLAHRLGRYDINSKVIRLGTSTARGYAREDLHDAWQRYLGPSLSTQGNVTSVTSVTERRD